MNNPKKEKKTIPFTIATKNKILRNKTSKKVKNSYTENYKMQLKQTEDINGKTSHVPELEDKILLKC